MYIDIFNKAKSKYIKTEIRAGYPVGWFTRFRHSTSLTEHQDKLEKGLKGATSDEQAIALLKEFLNNKDTTFNNHSFAMYLIDELTRDDSSNNWEDFYPKEKKYHFMKVVKIYIEERCKSLMMHL